MPPSEIRKEAREALKGKWGKAVLIVLGFVAVSMLVGFIQELISEESILYSILDIAYLVINIPLSFGLIVSFIKLKRGKEVSAFDFIKEGFTRFGKSWGIAWHTFIKLLLPMACFVFIVILHFDLMFSNATVPLNGVFSLLYVILLIFTIIYIACRALLYVLSYYILFDNPELSSKECVKKSEELMKGHRGNYFMLELSFIGWAIFAAFSFGIGIFWLMPYMQVATVCFYEKVAKIETITTKPAEKVEE